MGAFQVLGHAFRFLLQNKATVFLSIALLTIVVIPALLMQKFFLIQGIPTQTKNVLAVIYYIIFWACMNGFRLFIIEGYLKREYKKTFFHHMFSAETGMFVWNMAKVLITLGSIVLAIGIPIVFLFMYLVKAAPVLKGLFILVFGAFGAASYFIINTTLDARTSFIGPSIVLNQKAGIFASLKNTKGVGWPIFKYIFLINILKGITFLSYILTANLVTYAVVMAFSDVLFAGQSNIDVSSPFLDVFFSGLLFMFITFIDAAMQIGFGYFFVEKEKGTYE